MNTNYMPQYENSLDASTKLMLDLKGAQDVYMQIKDKTEHSTWNTKKLLLSQPHKYKYQFIGNFGGCPGRNRKIRMTIPRGNHLISALDLVLNHDNDPNIENIIKCIEVEIGGQRIDRVMSLKEIQLNCEIFNSHRKVTTATNEDGTCTTIIPLELSPLRGQEVCLLSCLYLHEFCLNVGFGDFPVIEAEVWGNTYNFNEDIWNKMVQERHDTMIIQNQFTGEERINLGTPTKIKLSFNHPVVCLYFWGVEKQYIKKIILRLNDHDYLEATPLMLDHIAAARGINTKETNDACVIFLCDGDLKYPYSWLNFTQIDHAELRFILSGDPTIEKSLHVVALNHQPLRIMSGMAGLAFSK
jgi:hypothetical protein